MADRKAELERKKARLAAMREEKKRKEEDKKKKEEAEATAAKAQPNDLRQETEQMLKDLGIPAGPAVAPKTAAPAPVAQVPDQAGIPQAAVPAVSPATAKKLCMSKVTQTNIPPKESISYNKETQTIIDAHEEKGRSSWDYYDDLKYLSPNAISSPRPIIGSPRFFPHGLAGSPRYGSRYGSPHSVGSGRFANLEWDDEFILQVLTYDDHRLLDEDDHLFHEASSGTPPAHLTKMPHVEMFKPAQTQEDLQPKKEEERKRVVDLSEEEKLQLMMSEEFHQFFDRSTRVMERALAEEEVNIFLDYSKGEGEDGEGGVNAGERLKLNREFYDERWSKHRTVTCLDWSSQHPELLLASYNNNEDAPHEPDGVALIWNQRYKKTTPEYIFHCQSAVMSACFAKFHPHLVVGGTYSGQIVLWDNRSNKRTPVQRTPLSAAAHTHPVYCVNVVGTQNAHNLISVSTDGKMCSWSLDMLSQPQDSMELQHRQSKAVAVTSLSFLSGDVNNFVVGSEEGAVYTACRHGSKAGIADMFEGHQGPVTGIDTNIVPGQIDFSQLFLTSSFDWTVKLWSIKEQRPLYSFEDNSDYVYDVKWSPIHPALFASVDGMGRLDLWNLNNDTEVPTASVTVDAATSLNRCRWHSAGHMIAVGDDMGKVYIYDVGENIANPRMDEWSRFVHTLQEIKNNTADRDEEPSSLSSMSLPLR